MSNSNDSPIDYGIIPLTPSGAARCFDPGTAHIMSWDVTRKRGIYVCPVCADLLDRRVGETTAEPYEDHARAYSARYFAAASIAYGKALA